MKKLSSLTIFFPFFNDAGTVGKAVDLAFEVGEQVAKKVEVIAIHGGPSHDATWQEVKKAQRRHRSLKVLDKRNNKHGYAVIRYGFQAATRDWVFYTDGDLQYNVRELVRLVRVQGKTQADVVNGYKRSRGDAVGRVMAGWIYAQLARLAFRLPIRDVDCDFRLMRRSLLSKLKFMSAHSSILPELITKLSRAGATFAEVPVSHRPRRYGSSNYSVSQLVKEKIIGDSKLWLQLLGK